MHATLLACEVLRYSQLQADVILAASLVLLCLCVMFASDSLTSRSIVAMYLLHCSGHAVGTAHEMSDVR